MQIQVKCSCGQGSCPEWAIVELQGVVVSQSSIGDQLQNLKIGHLCCSLLPSSSSQVYTFTVGYHELSGMKVALKKPLVVLRKKKLVSKELDYTTPGVEMEVIGIIRHKILFKNRPKALISKPETKEGKHLSNQAHNT